MNSVIKVLKETIRRIILPVIVGITERFNESLQLFAKIAGWKTTHYVEKSPSRAFSRKRKYPASPELLQAIKKYNQLDMQVYETAKKVFDKELQKFMASDG